jgi:outer membrane protein OmpA-like peptidoglycan-associated protein
MIEGYTDSRGSETANKKIATERAEGARKLLVDRGIDPSRIEVKGVGEENPIADNGTADGRQENRRVELIFSDAQGRFASASAPAATG